MYAFWADLGTYWSSLKVTSELYGGILNGCRLSQEEIVWSLKSENRVVTNEELEKGCNWVLQRSEGRNKK